MRSQIKKMLPAKLIHLVQRLSLANEQFWNKRRSAEDVFTEIYANNLWGGVAGDFCSGSGTSESRLVSAYKEAIFNFNDELNFKESTFVDLGCGDFRVGNELRRWSKNYVGVDVVGPLIQHNNSTYGDAHTTFVQLDITTQELPKGDICFVRQVLQHLSNSQIASVLQKLSAYKAVFITEHYPSNLDGVVPNLDKVHGSKIRIYKRSAVFLDAAPFNIPTECLQLILTVPGEKVLVENDAGVLKTFLYRTKSA